MYQHAICKFDELRLSALRAYAERDFSTLSWGALLQAADDFAALYSGGWRPVESAPTCGTKTVLVTDGRMAVIARYLDNAWVAQSTTLGDSKLGTAIDGVIAWSPVPSMLGEFPLSDY